MFQTSTQSDRQSQVWWERNSCSIQDYTLQSNSRRLPSIIYKGNRCTLNMKENALKMFWPKSYLLIRKEGKLPKAYGNSTFQLIQIPFPLNLREKHIFHIFKKELLFSLLSSFILIFIFIYSIFPTQLNISIYEPFAQI